MLNRHHNNPPADQKIVEPWRALPGSQMDFYSYDANHLLYTGSRGPGKTDAQLMRFKRRVGRGYGSFWRGILFDQEYKNLEDIIAKSQRWFPLFDDGAKFLSSNSDLKWVWPTGEELLFRHISKPQDYWKYHGHEYPFIGWNELCKFANADLYEAMMSCNRSSYTPTKDGFVGGARQKIGPPKGYNADGSFGFPEPIPLEVCSTTNPYGPGHNWVKRRFITPAPMGHPVITTTKVYDPAQKCDVEVNVSQVTFFGSYRENPYLSPVYIAGIKNLRDKNKRKAWLGGSWDIVAGGAFDDVWDATRHVIGRFKVPKTWHVDRSFDWGSSHPASVGWWCEANGEEMTYEDGTTWAPPVGTLIQIDELYFTQDIGTNIGLKLSASTIAERIKERETKLLADGWIVNRPWPGPADNQIRDVRESDVDTIETKMSDVGIDWERSDKSPGSRKNGLQLARDRLQAVLDNEDKPGLYFTENCRASIDLIPTLPRDDKELDDVDTDAEDHPWDMTRYRVLKSVNRAVRTFSVSHPT